MTATHDLASDTVLIVDDEQPVRTTFREWLEESGLGLRVLLAADAQEALVLANQQPIDLAVLDWNLGAGIDGLHLLQDLAFFQPEIIAILVTGYAQQATPLEAMRMGVRDYLDKNHDLDRERFLAVVKNQLERIRPAKRQRQIHRDLVSFREAVARVLPLVQGSAILNDPVPVPAAVATLLRFLVESTGAVDGVLFVRSHDPARQPPEVCRVFDRTGKLLEHDTVPFSRSLAGAVAGLGEIRIWQRAAGSHSDELILQPFEKDCQCILAAPIPVVPGVQAVLELFDKPGGFAAADLRTAAVGAEVGAALLQQAFAERQSQKLLLDAVEAALQASDSFATSLLGVQTGERPAEAAITSLREGLKSEDELKLIQQVRDLAVTHGQEALRHCLRLIQSTAVLLDPGAATEARP